MNRGQITLFTNVFPSALESKPNRKVTRNVFQEERDIAIAHRYYYYIHLKRHRYDDTLVYMERDFYLTADYIGTLLAPYVPLVKELIKKEVKIPLLKRKYPQYNWAA